MEKDGIGLAYRTHQQMNNSIKRLSKALKGKEERDLGVNGGKI
jgi:hypothetical protein